MIQSPVVAYAYPDGQYWDNTPYSLPLNTYRAVVTLYYQTTSKELIEFLRDENVTDDAGQIMYDLWDTNGKSAPVVMNRETIYIGEPPTFAVHVRNLLVTRAQQGRRWVGVGTVSIADQGGTPAAGVTVTADYTGPTSGTVTGITDGNGVVVLTTKADRKGATDWCFTVIDVVADGFTYDPTANIVTSACEGGPVVKDSDLPLPTGFALDQNHPNPFNPSTDISFNLPMATNVTLKIYNVKGQTIATLHEGRLEAGVHTFTWDGSNVASGIYLYRLMAGDRAETKRMVLLK